MSNETQCQEPCDPDVGCELCAGYWRYMEHEGLWDRDAHRWTDPAWRRILQGTL